jgi:polysaccharide export outer membrane protein
VSQGRAHVRTPTLALVAAALLGVSPAGATAQQPPPTAATPAPANAEEAAQAEAAAATPQPAPEATTPNDYQVGVGDVLEITVFGNADLSRTATVQANGTMALSLLGDVPVAGLSVADVRQKLTFLLGRDYLVDPQVEVRVKEYNSQFAFVVGEVNSPGKKPLRGRTRLIDVLVESGGFTPRASGEVVITRSEGNFPDGTRTLRLRLGGSLTAQDQVNLEVPLQNGDIITASPKYFVTVEGEVNRAGRYAIESDLTLTGAISLAGGFTRFGSTKVKLRRTDAQTGKVEILEINLKDVRDGDAPDPRLQPNDVVTVPRRLF